MIIFMVYPLMAINISYFQEINFMIKIKLIINNAHSKFSGSSFEFKQIEIFHIYIYIKNLYN